MPCRSEYCEPSAREVESKRVCGLLVYLLELLGDTVPAGYPDAAKSMYGRENILDEATAHLCQLCGDLTLDQKDTFMYDGRNAKARRLADWWDRHQAADRKREAEETREAEARVVLWAKNAPPEAKAVLDKIKCNLMPADRKILGLE